MLPLKRFVTFTAMEGLTMHPLNVEVDGIRRLVTGIMLASMQGVAASFSAFSDAIKRQDPRSWSIGMGGQSTPDFRPSSFVKDPPKDVVPANVFTASPQAAFGPPLGLALANTSGKTRISAVPSPEWKVENRMDNHSVDNVLLYKYIVSDIRDGDSVVLFDAPASTVEGIRKEDLHGYLLSEFMQLINDRRVGTPLAWRPTVEYIPNPNGPPTPVERRNAPADVTLTDDNKHVTALGPDTRKKLRLTHEVLREEAKPPFDYQRRLVVALERLASK